MFGRQVFFYNCEEIITCDSRCLLSNVYIHPSAPQLVSLINRCTCEY